MPTREQEIEWRKQWFLAKLAAEKQKAEVVRKVKEGPASKQDFVLLDTRDRASYEKEHLPGAIPMGSEKGTRMPETATRGLAGVAPDPDPKPDRPKEPTPTQPTPREPTNPQPPPERAPPREPAPIEMPNQPPRPSIPDPDAVR